MLAVASALLLVFAPTAPADDEAVEKELKKLEGDWQMVAATYNGTVVKGDKLKGKVWRFEGTKLTPLDNKNDVATIKIDPSKKPAELDITDKGGKVVEGIYRFEGTKLFILGRTDGKCSSWSASRSDAVPRSRKRLHLVLAPDAFASRKRLRGKRRRCRSRYACYNTHSFVYAVT
jgi:uncharacterized protein (TIGR03067 family)